MDTEIISIWIFNKLIFPDIDQLRALRIPHERDITADLLKGWAVVFMIQVHIVELFALQEIYESTLGSLLLFIGGPPAAPVFMAVMGYYIAKGNKSTLANIVRGAKLIGLGFILNVALNAHLLIKIYSGTIVINPGPYLFGADILILAGLSIIILTLLIKVFPKNPLASFIFILIIFFNIIFFLI